MDLSFNQIDVNFNKGKLISGIIYPEFFPFDKEDNVLNVGCGDGVQAIVYGGKFKKMVGVDINQERLKVAQQLATHYGFDNFQTICANAEKIPLEEKFDKIMAIDAVEHVVNPDRLISEVYRLLKDEGRLLITFPTMHDKWENLFRFVGRKIFLFSGLNFGAFSTSFTFLTFFFSSTLTPLTFFASLFSLISLRTKLI
ncbi:MAG: Methyltransferase type 11 [Parcubacteria group bacterium LiPW_39]|nr:MAG: Methyltransferase type 11 [Parcubacteria group bacterium LiPW_39]